MDRTLRAEIVMELNKALRSAMELNHEVYVSGEQLSKQFSCFSKSWLKNYGHCLPRTQTIVTDPDGTEHCGSWAYPLHRIQRMIASNEIKKLKR